MIGLWSAVGLTIGIAFIGIGLDWIGSWLVVAVRTIRSIERIARTGLAQQDAQRDLRTALERYAAAREASAVWGADLAMIAISLDAVALGIWNHSRHMLPFFTRFNSESVTYEETVWILVFVCHVVLFLGTLLFKHNHAFVASLSVAGQGGFHPVIWLRRNAWMLLANGLGAVALLSAIVVLTNAV